VILSRQNSTAKTKTVINTWLVLVIIILVMMASTFGNPITTKSALSANIVNNYHNNDRNNNWRERVKITFPVCSKYTLLYSLYINFI